MRYEHTRRQTVKAVGAVAVGTALAGCGSTDGSTDGADGIRETGTGGNGTRGEGTGGNPDGVVDVVIRMTDDLEFEPAKLNVDSGNTVAWKNVGSVTHTVTAYEDRIPAEATYFASGGASSEQAGRDSYPPDGGIAAGESYEHTFEETGTYEYFCIPHEGNGMTGTIDVFNKAGGDAGCIDLPCKVTR